MAYLRVRSAALEQKSQPSAETSYPPSVPLLDKIGEKSYAAAAASVVTQASEPTALSSESGKLEIPIPPSVARHGRWVGIGNVQSDVSSSSSIEEETLACFEKLKGTKDHAYYFYLSSVP